ncbi:MAG TPA: thioesterase domain-containing protein, partial [Gemmatimonadaceae bacterium]
ADLLEARTIRALAQRAVSARRQSPGAAEPARQAARSEWMPFDAGRRRALRLFCFPYAGGGAHIYHSWIDTLGDDVEVCPIELPGRGTRFSTTPATDAERLLTELHDVLRPLTEDAYAIVGQSMGSLLASAVAQRLRSSGAKPPAALIVAASPPPSRSAQPSVDATMSDDAMIASLATTDDEAPRELVAHGELRRLLVPILRADLELSDRLLSLEGPPLSCPIVAFAGRGDPLVSPAQMAAWASATTERFELVAVTGGHFVLRTRWSEVFPVLRRVLGDAIRGSPGHRAS